MVEQTNLRILRPNRKRPEPGDIFAIGLPGDRFLFGRVIRSDIPRGRAPMPGSNLIYVYRDPSESSEPDTELLTPERLLIPPTFTNRQPWTRGYFEPVVTLPLKRQDLLLQHCFRDAIRQGFRGLDGEKVTRPTEPFGEWGLTSYRMIDDLISDAVGIPRVPGGPNS